MFVLTVWSLLCLVLAGVVIGPALVMLFLGLIAWVARDELATDCLAWGGILLLLAGYIVVKVYAV